MSETLFEDRYRLIRQIGSGGMGVVYEAEDVLLKKVVAIKTIKKGFLTAELVIRFQREASALALLNHSCLVPLYVFGITEDNQPYMVMQYVQGKSLTELIEARGYLPVHKSLNIFLQLCDAIQHAHEHGVLHRDLKPSNVILKNAETEHPDVVLIDFGIAMVADNNSMDALTKTGILVGTPSYMSPEQISGKELDERCDIYALGCIMFETLTGVKPFAASSTLEMLAAKISQRAPSINAAVHDLTFSTGLDEIVDRCLEVDPDLRYESAAALKHDLMRLKSGEYSAHSEAGGNPTMLEGSSRKKKKSLNGKSLILISLGAIFGATGIAAVAAFLWFPQLISVSQSSKYSMAKQLRLSIPENEEGTVKGRTLHFFNIKGSDVDKSIHDEIGKKFKRHKNLNTVEIRESNITGECFEGLEDLPIEGIKIVASSLVEPANLSDEGLLSISKIASLNSLSFEGCSLSAKGIEHLSKLPGLCTLVMADCSLDLEKIKAICMLKHVTWLDLKSDQGVGDAEVGLLAKQMKLYHIALEGTAVKIDGIKSLGKMKTLRALVLKNAKLNGNAVKVVSGFDELTHLDIKVNDNLTDQDVSPLLKMKSLTLLGLDSPKVSDATIQLLHRNVANVDSSRALSGRVSGEFMEIELDYTTHTKKSGSNSADEKDPGLLIDKALERFSESRKRR